MGNWVILTGDLEHGFVAEGPYDDDAIEAAWEIKVDGEVSAYVLDLKPPMTFDSVAPDVAPSPIEIGSDTGGYDPFPEERNSEADYLNDMFRGARARGGIGSEVRARRRS